MGGHVARALCEDGWTVRALARKREALAGEEWRDLPLEPIAGDLSDSSASVLRERLRGCEAIVHVAGLVKARSLEDYREVNVRGTERLLDAAAVSAPGALFLLISSQAAAGPARDGAPVKETDPARPVSWYGRSKLEAEAAVASRWKGAWVVVRPAVVYGAGDRGLLTFFRAANRGWVPVPAAGSRIQIIEATRAALAVALCLRRPELARRIAFLCDPDAVEIRTLTRMIAKLPERRARLVSVPDWFVRIAGLAATLSETVTGRSLSFNSDKAKEILAGDWLCEPELMQRHLSLPPPSPLEYGLKKTWEWYRARGWIPSPPPG